MLLLLYCLLYCLAVDMVVPPFPVQYCITRIKPYQTLKAQIHNQLVLYLYVRYIACSTHGVDQCDEFCLVVTPAAAKVAAGWSSCCCPAAP
jgi:hypothetical protein